MIPKRSLYALAKTLRGLPILGALAGSPTARIGVRYGDVLLEVNGQRTTTLLEFIEARALREDGMDFVVFRDGAELELSVSYDEAEPADAASLLGQLVAMRLGPIDAEEGPPEGTS